ncbi:MAG: hypothetical protein JWO98_4914 [Frankiales bacterium]|nr:hypothetical protein [Frankiales bacterium]
MSECRTCGGYGMKHDPMAHDDRQWHFGYVCRRTDGCTPDPCDHEWTERGGPGDEWRECWLCGLQEDQ